MLAGLLLWWKNACITEFVVFTLILLRNTETSLCLGQVRFIFIRNYSVLMSDVVWNEMLQVKILLRSTLCYRGKITSGSIIVQALPGQLHQIGELCDHLYVWNECFCVSVLISVYCCYAYLVIRLVIVNQNWKILKLHMFHVWNQL